MPATRPARNVGQSAPPGAYPDAGSVGLSAVGSVPAGASGAFPRDGTPWRPHMTALGRPGREWYKGLTVTGIPEATPTLACPQPPCRATATAGVVPPETRRETHIRSIPLRVRSLALALTLPGLSFADVTLPNFLWDMRLERAMGPDLVVNRLVGDNAYPFRLFCWRSQDAEPRYAGVAIPAGLTVRQVTTESLIPVPDSVCRAWLKGG